MVHRGQCKLPIVFRHPKELSNMLNLSTFDCKVKDPMHSFLRSMIAFWVFLLSPVVTGFVTAHELRPAVGDLTVTPQGAVLTLSMNIEALLAGIDLDNLENTDASPGSGRYDRLRGLSPETLQTQIKTFFPRLLPGILLQDGNQLQRFTLSAVSVDAVGDPNLPRDSLLELTIEEPITSLSVLFHWPKGFGALILRQMGTDNGYTGYLGGGEKSDPIRLAGNFNQTAIGALIQYIPVGFDHILPKGLDHILFVLGLYFLSVRFGVLLWQISAFTVAHTVTLALGAMGLVTVPATIVEPLIAASIVFVAVENIASPKLHAWRPAVVFGFGLLHGLGFASVLGEFGLPQGQFIPALIGFNIGVELGQLTVIAIMILTLGLWFGSQSWFRTRIAVPASALIGIIGAWWCVERTLL